MSRLMQLYISSIDRVNLRIGRIVMYGIFVLMGILLWSSISKTFFLPSLWTLEMAQFTMVAYYILGGPYSLQMGSNVRMDLFYGTWSLRKKAWFDLLTVLFLIFYLGVLFYGAISSTAYSLAAGGAVVTPRAEVLTINPICPQALSNRPLIVSMGSTIEVKVLKHRAETFLSADGQMQAELKQHDQIIIRRSRQKARLVRLEGSSFFETLRHKLNWTGSHA